MFRTVPLSIIRSFPLYTQQWYMSYRFADSLRAGSACSKAVYKPVWHIPLLCVQWKTHDNGQGSCPEHVDSHSKYIWEISASGWFYYKKCFGQFLCPSSGVFHRTHTAMVYVIQVCRQLSSRLSLLKSRLQTCMTHTIAVCTVENSWWWTEELSETCRVSFQNKFEKLVHLSNPITGLDRP